MTPPLRLKADAYAPEALVEAGVDPEVVMHLLADDAGGVLERPRLSLTTRKRGHLTSRYVWGPDALILLSER